MNFPYISIIIPIYQVEAYIEDCVSSVASQTYQGQMECILIDDCGLDQSLRITQQFIANYKGPISFRMIRHEKNRGVSAARNTGIMAAEGDFLFFIDSDDTITPDCIETMVEYIQKESVDMVCGAFETIGGNHHWWSNGYQLPKILIKDRQQIIDLFCSGQLYDMPWNKLIRKELIINNHLYFKEGIILEDKLWSVLLVNVLSSIQTINKITYYYRIHNKSQMNDPNQILKRINSGLVFQEEMDRFIKEGMILPTTKTLFRIRREKNRVGVAIINCQSIPLIKKIAYLYRLIKLPGCHHFIYAILCRKKYYAENPL